MCLSVYRSLDVCMCLHNAWTRNVYVCPLVYTHGFVLMWMLLNLHKHVTVCVFVCVPTIMTGCSNFVCVNTSISTM